MIRPGCCVAGTALPNRRGVSKGEPVPFFTGEVKRIAHTGSWLLDHSVRKKATVGEAIHALLARLSDEQSAGLR